MSGYLLLLRGGDYYTAPALSQVMAPVTGEGLRGILSYIGFKNVRIQPETGDAAFEAIDNNRRKMEAEIGYELKHAFRTDRGVVLLTQEEFRAMAARHPLSDRGDEDKLFITILTHEPAREDVAMLMETMNGVDEHAVIGKAVYSYYGAGYESSRRSTEFIEKVMKIQAATRTWKALRALLGLLSNEKLDVDSGARRSIPRQ
ncbi:MAG: hypothetical protein A2Y38_22155 [Spirochaetes bacterium GWB1_59_5]|nr:MAG: hypothetical protein A2Y38_22155 [Spirochaetes bacterium GWB1_59_5]